MKDEGIASLTSATWVSLFSLCKVPSEVSWLNIRPVFRYIFTRFNLFIRFFLPRSPFAAPFLTFVKISSDRAPSVGEICLIFLLAVPLRRTFAFEGISRRRNVGIYFPNLSGQYRVETLIFDSSEKSKYEEFRERILCCIYISQFFAITVTILLTSTSIFIFPFEAMQLCSEYRI